MNLPVSHEDPVLPEKPDSMMKSLECVAVPRFFRLLGKPAKE